MLWWMFQNVLIAAALAGLVWLICRIRWLSPAARHALWLIVLVKLITPPLVVWPWAIPTDWQATSGHVEPALPANWPQAELSTEVGLPEEPLPVVSLPAVETRLSIEPARTALSYELLWSAAGMAWLIGGVVIALVQAIRIVRMQL